MPAKSSESPWLLSSLVLLCLVSGCNAGGKDTAGMSALRDLDGDGVWNDLDCDPEDPTVGAAQRWYLDLDGDGYGEAGLSFTSCQQPAGYVDTPGDCDDGDPLVHPGAAEYCDGLDNDCDGDVDEPDAVDVSTCYRDFDGDGYGDPQDGAMACEPPEGYVWDSTDCDDTQSTIHPGAPEYCDGLDDDCDGQVDEGAIDTPSWYPDADGDGYGVDDPSIESCDAPHGHVSANGDCDDGDDSINPGADEYCDGVDNDCDGVVDGETALDAGDWYLDSDGDGYGDSSSSLRSCQRVPGYVSTAGDCNDDRAQINPGVDEQCTDYHPGSVELGDAHLQVLGEAVGDQAACSLASAGDVDGDGYGDLLVGACGSDLAGQDSGAAYLLSGLLLLETEGHASLSGATARLLGEAPHDMAGSDVASAGDVNGDGYHDVLVAAWQEYSGDGWPGAAYLVLGPVSGDMSLGDSQASFTGEDWLQKAGASVSSAGDVNGDSLDDILIGAWEFDWNADGSANSAGAVYLVTGPVTGPMELDAAGPAILGEQDGDHASYAAAAGDVNGDGLADMMVGAPGESTAGQDAGAAYLVMGPLSASIALRDADARLLGESAGDCAGISVAAAGDVDADGHGDLLVGAWGESSGASGAGAAYLVSGPVSGELSLEYATSRMSGEAQDDKAGAAVSSAGDLNGDGYADLLIGAPGQNAHDLDKGAVYILLGPLMGHISLAEASVKLLGESTGDEAGQALAMGGDMDGDGLGEVFVGAWRRDMAGSDAGSLYLFLGGDLFDRVDEDCDGLLDEPGASGASTWYADADGDGYGDPDDSTISCLTPSGYVAFAADCDDSRASVHKDAPEYCDGLDNDCDDQTDEDGALDAPTWYADADGDGWGDADATVDQTRQACGAADGYVQRRGDCDDSRSTVNPDADELCNDTDDDCDGMVDEDDATDAPTWYLDADGDGYGDDAFSATACQQPSGWVAMGGDCDDADSGSAPDLAELCDDGTDNDCDGAIDEGATWYADADGDGYGDSWTATETCDPPGDHVAQGGDCDDSDPSSNPGAAEVCDDGTDNDCDGLVDEGPTWYLDADGDGYGDPATAWESCEQPSGYVDSAEDCDDSDAEINPGALDYCDGPERWAAAAEASAQLLGDDDGGSAGFSVHAAGDMNLDGYDDIILGANLADAEARASGMAYLVLGPLSGQQSLEDAYASLRGMGAGANAGISVSGAADVDNDGYPDLLVGAWRDASAGEDAGAAYLVSGPVNGIRNLPDAGFELLGEQGSQVGFRVAMVGDSNGDAFDDFLVGAFSHDLGGEDAGAAYLVLGPVTADASLDERGSLFIGESGGDYAGRALAGAGDTNADGLDDLLLGAYGQDTAGDEAGAAYLFLGPVTRDMDLADAHARLLGESGGDQAGRALAGVGDINGDGFDDLLLGSRGQGTAGVSAGAAYLVLGPVSGELGLGQADARILGEAAGDLAGYAVAGAGDVDGDNLADLLVGAMGESSNGEESGAAYLLLGPLTGGLSLADAHVKVLGSAQSDQLGASLAGAGDVNADGLDDYVLGAPGESGAGAVFLFPGASFQQVDQDCDGQTDDAAEASTWYLDSDHDGYGQAESWQVACFRPWGHVSDSQDCDDDDASLNPGMNRYADEDGDGHGDPDLALSSCSAPDDWVGDADDCDDSDSAVYPGALEYCDGLDNDCDGELDEADASDASSWYLDSDGDGYGDSTLLSTACYQPDGYSAEPGDCDDSMDSVHPGALEYCDGLDDDCDGEVDGPDPVDTVTWYADADADGHGDPDVTSEACGAVSGMVLLDDDCDDSDEARSPDALELCGDSLDNDCDGELDETSTWYLDGDGDGYGQSEFQVEACDAPSGYVALAGDCDDGDALVNPASWELCSGIAGENDLGSWDTIVDGSDGDELGAALVPAGDMDADGLGDLLLGAPGAGAAYLLSGPVTGASSVADVGLEIRWDLEASGLGSALAALGDQDGDGFDDLLLGASGASTVWLLSGPLTADLDLPDRGLRLSGPEGSSAGWSLSSAGDVNSDGNVDLLVGAPEDNEAGYGAGSAFLVHGPVETHLDLELDSTRLWGSSVHSNAGSALASAGDTNGDGLDDVLIGASAQFWGGVGQAYLVCHVSDGSMDLSDSQALLLGENDGDGAGSAVAGGADLNADGFDDLLVGAPGSDRGAVDAGLVYVVLGPVTGDVSLSDAPLQLLAQQENGGAGTSLSLGGDVDGDGLADLLVGADGGRGQAWLWSGASLAGLEGQVYMDTADALFPGEGEGDMAGASLSLLGDLDADAVYDIVLGAPGFGDLAGRVYLLPGSSQPDEDCDGSIDEDDALDAVAWYPDLDGDGWGASDSAALSCYPGAEQVALSGDCDDDDPAVNPDAVDSCLLDSDCDGLLGGQCELDSLDQAIFGVEQSDLAGWSLAWLGDVDGDTLDDILVGVPGMSSAGEGAGGACLFTAATLAESQDWISMDQADATFVGKHGGDAAGFALTGLGDVTGDGITDLLLGAPGDDSSATDAGAAYLWAGPFSGVVDLADAGIVLTGEGQGSSAGCSVSGAGDIDGDGTPDLLVGASGGAGALFVLTGPITTSVNLGGVEQVFRGEQDGDAAGCSVSFVGDVDGDGLDDILAGATGADQGRRSDYGAAYLLLGPATAVHDLSSADLALLGEGYGDMAGQDVAAAGDVDGDGLADILVGIGGSEAGSRAGGAAYLLTGSTLAAMDSVASLSDADATLLGLSEGDQAGFSVAAAGDVNGDFLDDILVGAPGEASAGVEAGRVYLLLAPLLGTSTLDDARATFSASRAGYLAGWSVSGAGDPDGDGLGDILLGAPGADGQEHGFEEQGGAVYLLHGTSGF